MKRDLIPSAVAAQLLNCSVDTVRQYVRRDYLTKVELPDVPGRAFFSRREVERLAARLPLPPGPKGPRKTKNNVK